jgi:anti-sigma B factor antagonist
VEVAVREPANSETGPDESAQGEAVQVRALNAAPTSQQLEVTVDRPTDDVVVLHVVGEVDLLTATVLGERIREHLGVTRTLILDLSGVSFLGSAGLAEIVSTSQESTDSGARLVLVATSRAVLRPMEVTGLLSLFPVYQSVEAALAGS